jgi:hypothetical protein
VEDSNAPYSRGARDILALGVLFWGALFGLTLIALAAFTLLFDIWQVLPRSTLLNVDDVTLAPLIGFVGAIAMTASAIRNRQPARQAIGFGMTIAVVAVLILWFISGIQPAT